ncbi:MAG: putative toxin-antitoxin system toxin component, PIN family [Oscillospiraceae bacterium]|nr:putative toxin-antitoxin system toxin component, PIN family [Oscillospiraceae bacterium]
MLVVVDTNVIVSAFWSKGGNPAKIISLIQNYLITPCYDYRIMQEYEEVLSRKKFGFESWEINNFLSQIKHDGISVVAPHIDIVFSDESDKMFYEVAKKCNAVLITGNSKHFPKDDCVVTPTDFLNTFKPR